MTSPRFTPVVYVNTVKDLPKAFGVYLRLVQMKLGSKAVIISDDLSPCYKILEDFMYPNNDLLFGLTPPLTDEEIAIIWEAVSCVRKAERQFRNPEIICFEGPAGTGKTTFISKRNGFTLDFFEWCNQPYVSYEDILHKFNVGSEVHCSWVRNKFKFVVDSFYSGYFDAMDSGVNRNYVANNNVGDFPNGKTVSRFTQFDVSKMLPHYDGATVHSLDQEFKCWLNQEAREVYVDRHPMSIPIYDYIVCQMEDSMTPEIEKDCVRRFFQELCIQHVPHLTFIPIITSSNQMDGYIKRYQTRAKNIPYPNALPQTKQFLVNQVYQFHSESEETIRNYYAIQTAAFRYFMNFATKNDNLVVKYIDAYPDEAKQIYPDQSSRSVLSCLKNVDRYEGVLTTSL